MDYIATNGGLVTAATYPYNAQTEAGTATASDWSSYTGGVMTSSSCSSSSMQLDHAIQLVGYNADASTPYWIVRNSWDTTWGNDGYIYLAMGENTCGLADKAAMVTL